MLEYDEEINTRNLELTLIKLKFLEINYIYICIYILFITIVAQPKQPISFGDEPDLYKKAQGRNSPILNNGNTTANPIADTSVTTINPASGKINLENSSNDCESGYVPTVGRWGAEWPS